MAQIIIDTTNSTIKLTETYNIQSATSSIDHTPYFNSIDDEFDMSFIDLRGVKTFTSYEVDVIGDLDTRYLKAYYKTSRDQIHWTNWLELKPLIDNFPIVDPLDPLYMDIRWVRTGTNNISSLRLLSFTLNGIIDPVNVFNDTNVIIPPGGEVIIKPPFIYKVFRLDDTETISTDNDSLSIIKYRFSQDNSRSWTSWEPLTKENISTVRISPIRFFQIEYSIYNSGSQSVHLYDLNLVGDFQNLTLDSRKTNLLGLRECCQSGLVASSDNVSNPGVIDSATGQFIPNTSGMLGSSNGDNCSTGILGPLTDLQKSTLYNPYQQNTAVDLLNKLSNDAVQIFGFNVKYFVTDPDSNGVDYSLHEYQLYNVVCFNEFKISVDQNQFPDNQIAFNQFDLNLFDSFEVHITKEEFKSHFGIERRPSKEDILYFCDLNRLYIVDHAQPFRSFNNSSVYYKVILKKYNQSANVRAEEGIIKNTLETLTKNSTIEELMGFENDMDKKAIANKPQQDTLTNDSIRLKFNAPIESELIQNASLIVAKHFYDASSLIISTQSFLSSVVEYANVPNRMLVSDNIGFFIWFRIPNYVETESYNLYDHYDSTNQMGWKVNINNDKVDVVMNSYTYSMVLTDSLLEDTWYCYTVNINQRLRNIDQWIYKRNVDDEDNAKYLGSSKLLEVYKKSEDLVPVEWELENTTSKILVSDIHLTNITMFKEVIPVKEHNKILNMSVLRDDTQHLIFVDNVNKKLILPRFSIN